MKVNTAVFDNDIIYKIIACNLLEEIQSLFGISESYCRDSVGIRQFESMIKKQDQSLIQKSKPPLSHELKSSWINKFNQSITNFNQIPFEWKTTELAAKLCAEDIDAGEAELLAIALTYPEVRYCFSGDKRAIRAMRDIHTVFYNQLVQENRLICFEECILQLLNQNGFPWIQSRLMPSRQIDGSVDIILGVSRPNFENQFRDALNSMHPIKNYEDERKW
ncbi:MAG: hypothetical protein ORO03_09350 [Alphaproteobacteria bacterium]|nr:hypothetical protein [Alphaproteobacteria bacterium]